MFRASLAHGGLISLSAFLGIALIALFLQGAKIQRAIPSLELLWRYLTMTQSGHVWLGREVYGAALILMIWVFVKKVNGVKAVRTFAVLALPLVASRSLMSHAAALREGAAVAITADAIHSIATALWAGGLMALCRILFLAAKRWPQPASWLAEIINRFSRVALVSVAADYRYGCLSKLDPRRRFRNPGKYRLWENSDTQTSIFRSYARIGRSEFSLNKTSAEKPGARRRQPKLGAQTIIAKNCRRKYHGFTDFQRHWFADRASAGSSRLTSSSRDESVCHLDDRP